MSLARLPKNCDVAAAIRALGEAGAVDGSQPVVFQVEAGTSVDCAAVAALASWGLLQRAEGRRVSFTGDARALQKLEALGLPALLRTGLAPGAVGPGDAIPIRLIRSNADVAALSESVHDLLVRSLDRPADVERAVDWLVAELMENVVLHAQSAQGAPGVLTAQVRRAAKRLDIAIVDSGRGIMASLKESMAIWSHGDAIGKALRRGVTRDATVGQGNGLAGALEIVRRNGGALQMWSGDAAFLWKGYGDGDFKTMPELPGTGIAITLDTTRGVDLRDTWIAATRAKSYLRAAAARIDAGEPLRVSDEVPDTRTRAAAAGLRTKARNLLAASSQELILDFSGVRRASSSFLDEALGRLADEIGPAQFQQRVRIQNVDPVLLNQAETVIAQRVEQ
jgi:anti-sigma regulatory factor (Ser/Thr protein kinase)